MTARRAGSGALALVALALSAGDAPLGAQAPDSPPVPAADHHLHIRSAAGAEIARELGRAHGEPGPPETTEPTTGADVLAALDAAGAERGLVLSIAYMFGSPDLEVEDERARVRAENEYVAKQVAMAPERLVGACSVNPLADYALDEIGRCAADPGIGAFKLHFTNSDVDLRNEAHVKRLRSMFEALRRLGLPAVVHLRTRREDYGAEDARIFIEQVLSRAPDLPVQVAHMAGWGGYDDATDAALGAFVDAAAAGRVNADRLTFDLGAVVFQPAAAGADTALARQVREANERLAGRIREIGVERILFATDWPSWPPTRDPRLKIARNARLIAEELPLEPAELATIFANLGLILGGDGDRAGQPDR